MSNQNRFVVKHGLQTQNIQFVSSDRTQNISLQLLDSGELSFDGAAGQLFSITDDLTGVLFSVNDADGIPTIEADADGTIRIVEFGGHLLIGTGNNNETDILQVDGSAQFTGVVKSTVTTGTAPLVITSTTRVNNLNVELLNGQPGTFYLNTGTTFGGDLGGTASNITIQSDTIGAAQLKVTGNGTNGQVLSSLGTGSFAWINPSQDFGTVTVTGSSSGLSFSSSGSTSAGSLGDTLTVVGGAGIAVEVDASGRAIRINNTVAGEVEDLDSRYVNITGDTMTGLLTLSGDPTSSLHAATKNYVDTTAQGLKVRTAAWVLRDTNLPGTYNANGYQTGWATITATSNTAFPAIDSVASVTLNVVGARVLLTAQTNAAHNGLYVLEQVGSGSQPWILRRCSGCRLSEQIPGSFVFVKDGTVYANTGWVASVDSVSTFTIGVDSINWLQFSGAGTFTAGTGLTLVGTEFRHANTSSVSNLNNTNSGNTFIQDITFGFDQFGHVTAASVSTGTVVQSQDFGVVTVTGTDSGYSWSATGSATADAIKDTLTLVQGSGIALAVASADDAVRVSHANTSSISNLAANSGANEVIKDIAANFDQFGHVTSLTITRSDASVLIPDNIKSLQVTGTDSGYTWSSTGTVSATAVSDTVALVSGTGIEIDADVSSKAVRIRHANTSSVSNLDSSNAGNTFIQGISFGFDSFGHVTSASVSTGTVTSANSFGTVTITNTDSGFSWSTTGSAVADTPADTLIKVAGAGISLQVDAASDAVRITNTDRGSSQNIFKNVAVVRDNNTTRGTVVAGSNNDTLTIKESAGIVSTVDSVTKTITLQHANTSSQSSVSNSGGNMIQSVTLDTFGHVTGLSSTNLDTRYVDLTTNQTIDGTKTFSNAVVLSTAGTATDHAVRADRTITAGTGLTGGGNLTANRTINLENIQVGSSTAGAVYYNGTTRSIGRFYGGTTNPENDTRLNYDGHFHCTLFNGPLSGNADTATALQTARTINGTSFNGTANITVPGNFANRTTNESGHAVFIGTSATGNRAMYTNTSYRFNPSSGQLSATDFNSTSDVNLKDNISDIHNALEIVSRMRGVTYTWKDTGASGVGVIAQEIEQVLPQVVSDNGDHKTVSYGNIVGVLIEAIKQLQQEVYELKKGK